MVNQHVWFEDAVPFIRLRPACTYLTWKRILHDAWLYDTERCASLIDRLCMHTHTSYSARGGNIVCTLYKVTSQLFLHEVDSSPHFPSLTHPSAGWYRWNFYTHLLIDVVHSYTCTHPIVQGWPTVYTSHKGQPLGASTCGTTGEDTDSEEAWYGLRRRDGQLREFHNNYATLYLAMKLMYLTICWESVAEICPNYIY